MKHLPKLIQKREIQLMDYKKVTGVLLGNILKEDKEEYQYSIEPRGSCLHIVELNFKPHTKSTMSIPIPVYNSFTERLIEVVPREGIKANDIMAIFVEEYEKYRRNYLGELLPLKPSSYNRYASVLHLLWKVTDGALGFKTELKGPKSVNVIEYKDGKTIINSTTEGRGYYIIPTTNEIVKIIDKDQKLLGEF